MAFRRHTGRYLPPNIRYDHDFFVWQRSLMRNSHTATGEKCLQMTVNEYYELYHTKVDEKEQKALRWAVVTARMCLLRNTISIDFWSYIMKTIARLVIWRHRYRVETMTAFLYRMECTIELGASAVPQHGIPLPRRLHLRNARRRPRHYKAFVVVAKKMIIVDRDMLERASAAASKRVPRSTPELLNFNIITVAGPGHIAEEYCSRASTIRGQKKLVYLPALCLKICITWYWSTPALDAIKVISLYHVLKCPRQRPADRHSDGHHAFQPSDWGHMLRLFWSEPQTRYLKHFILQKAKIPICFCF